MNYYKPLLITSILVVCNLMFSLSLSLLFPFVHTSLSIAHVCNSYHCDRQLYSRLCFLFFFLILGCSQQQQHQPWNASFFLFAIRLTNMSPVRWNAHDDDENLTSVYYLEKISICKQYLCIFYIFYFSSVKTLNPKKNRINHLKNVYQDRCFSHI